MAKPIRNTPVLSGNDSKKFNAAISTNSTQKVSAQKREYMSNLVTNVLKKATI